MIPQSKLNLLVIEDSQADYLLVERNLQQHGVEASLHRVDSYPKLIQALEIGGWDAILSDYNLPGMDFRTTLDLLRDRVPDLPVILVSGSIGEEEALELLRNGLSDFVLKDRPTRLAGAIRHSLATYKALKAKRAAEAALLESESRFATMFRSSPMGIGVSRMSDGRLVEVNDALLEIYGREREEMLGKTTLEAGFFLHPEDRERMIDQLQREHRIRNFQFRFQRKDGMVGDQLMSMERIQLGGEEYLLGMTADITPLKQAERALLASEGRYHSLFDHMPEGLAHNRMIFEDGRPTDWEYLAVNKAYKQVTGLQGVVGRRASEAIPGLKDTNPELFERFGELTRAGVPIKFEVFLHALQTWFRVSAYRPAPGEFVAVLDDISEWKTAEADLRASESRFQSVFKASPAGIVLSRMRDGAILDANPAFLDLVGRDLEEVKGRSTKDLGLWRDPRVRDMVIQEVQATGRLHNLEAELLTPAGGSVLVTWSTQAIELNGEPVLVNLIQDVTDQRRAEAERRQMEADVAHAQKLESLGALAGGVSHDMNNVLAAIMAIGSTVQERYKDDASLTKTMATLLQAAGRGRDLVKGLRDFVRKDVPEPKPLTLNELVRHEADLLSRTTLQRVKVEVAIQEDLPAVMGDANSISNALMNLCVNALDAMPTGGRLDLITRQRPDGQVELAVRDSGQGMAPDVLQRALEPYFTTKPAGQGTGLGLSLVYGVMKAHGGNVIMESEVGVGTCITLVFPIHRRGGQAGVELPELPPTGGRRLLILLVDDDDLVRQAVPAMLEQLGHKVMAFAGGLEALRWIQDGVVPDLVLLDLSMPGMDGEETLTHLRLTLPEVPIFLATGYPDERAERILARFPDVIMLRKPFTSAELKTLLARLG